MQKHIKQRKFKQIEDEIKKGMERRKYQLLVYTSLTKIRQNYQANHDRDGIVPL